MNFEALPSNCFNIGKKVKMKVTSAVPLCLLAGMAIVTCGCTAMKLRSEDPAVRMEAVKSYTTVEDWFDIAISDYPEDVRLYALERLKDNQEAIDKIAAIVLYEDVYEDVDFHDFPYSWDNFSVYDPEPHRNKSRVETANKKMAECRKMLHAENLFFKRLLELCSTKQKLFLLGRRNFLLVYGNKMGDLVLAMLNSTPKASDKEIIAAEGGNALVNALQGCGKKRDILLAFVRNVPKGAIQAIVAEKILPDLLLGAGNDDNANKLIVELLSYIPKEKYSEIISKLNGNKVDEIEGLIGTSESKAYVLTVLDLMNTARSNNSFYLNRSEVASLLKRFDDERLMSLALESCWPNWMEDNAIVEQVLKYPNSTSAISLLVQTGKGRDLVLTEANAQKIFDRLQKRAASGSPEDEEVEAFAFIDLLNACPEFAQKVEPKAAVSLLKAEHACQAEKYAKLPLPIAQAFVEDGTWHHVSRYDENKKSPCPMSDAILKRLPVATAYDILKKQDLKPDVFIREIRTASGECALNDENVEALLRIDLAPFATGLYRLQAALKADAVSAESKAKIQAHIEKLRAEAEANEVKAKQERLVIDHCYVPMREIDHVALPPKKVLSYGEKNGIITSFGWTAKQCYDWFEIENDRFQWEFAKKFGLSNFKFDMSVKAESQTSFNPELLLFDAMSGADTAVVSVPKISVQQWWLSTTRERGKNVEFLYNEEDKNNTLIMREIQ